MFTTFNSSVTRTIVGTLGMAFCAGVCLVGATAPAAADTVYSTTRSKVVRYADLDLANAQGRAVLDRRIKVAAREVCTTNSTDPEMKIEEYRCLRHAIADAQPKVVAVASR